MSQKKLFPGTTTLETKKTTYITEACNVETEVTETVCRSHSKLGVESAKRKIRTQIHHSDGEIPRSGVSSVECLYVYSDTGTICPHNGTMDPTRRDKDNMSSEGRGEFH